MGRRVVRHFMTADEAQLARAQLEAVGIDAIVLHDGASRVIPGLGAGGGIPLEVDEADYDHAVETLDEPVVADEKAIAAHPELAPESVLPSGKKEPPKVPGKDAASRAFRTSIIGVFLCPGLLHLYSAWLLRLAFRDWAQLDASARRSAIVALVVNVAVVAAIAFGIAGAGRM
jgi:hypothetical protein